MSSHFFLTGEVYFTLLATCFFLGVIFLGTTATDGSAKASGAFKTSLLVNVTGNRISREHIRCYRPVRCYRATTFKTHVYSAQKNSTKVWMKSLYHLLQSCKIWDVTKFYTRCTKKVKSVHTVAWQKKSTSPRRGSMVHLPRLCMWRGTLFCCATRAGAAKRVMW